MEQETKNSFLPLFIVAFAIGFVLVSIFWLIYPYKVLAVELVEVSPKTVHAGDVVFLHSKFCVFTDKPIRVNTDLVGELVVIQLPPRNVQVTVPKGCDELTTTRQLPLINNVGTFYFESTATIKVNPLREVTVKWRSEEINIIEASKEGKVK